MRLLFAIIIAILLVGCSNPKKKFHEVEDPKVPPIASFHEVKTTNKLLVFFHPHCKFCHKFIEEIVPEYYKTKWNEKLPLVRMDVSKRETLKFIEQAYFDKRMQWIESWPIFVAWYGDEDGYQFYRMVGYSDKKTFYHHIDVIFDFFIDEH